MASSDKGSNIKRNKWFDSLWCASVRVFVCVCGCERESPRQPMFFKYKHRGCQICLYNTCYPLNWTCPVATFFIYSFVFKTATIKQRPLHVWDHCACRTVVKQALSGVRNSLFWTNTQYLPNPDPGMRLCAATGLSFFLICIFSPVCSKIVNSIKIKKKL